MDEDAFRKFLKRGGRKPHVVDRIMKLIRSYEDYLKKYRERPSLDQATPDDLVAFTLWYEEEKRKSAKSPLWVIRYYYRFTKKDPMAQLTSQLREKRTSKTRKPFQLKEFRGVNTEYVTKLMKYGIRSVDQMRERGQTYEQRVQLAKVLNIPEEAIVELVKLSDLARIPGLKGIRARLYFDAGVDTLEKLAAWDPKELRALLTRFVERTKFEGIAPLAKEAESAVKYAKELPKLIEF